MEEHQLRLKTKYYILVTRYKFYVESLQYFAMKKRKKRVRVYIACIISIKEGARMAQEPAKALNNRVIEC